MRKLTLRDTLNALPVHLLRQVYRYRFFCSAGTVLWRLWLSCVVQTAFCAAQTAFCASKTAFCAAKMAFCAAHTVFCAAKTVFCAAQPAFPAA